MTRPLAERDIRERLARRIGSVAFALAADTSFAVAGVPSIEVVGLVAELERELGLEVSEDEFFGPAGASVASLAGLLTRKRGEVA